jgi:putative flippase GtrA
MSAKHGVDVVPVGQDELSNQGSLFKHAIEAKAAVTQRQVYALMVYYMALLIGCIALITFMIVNNDGSVFKDASEPDSKRLLQSMAFLLSGAVVGSVLYQIRMLFRFYIKSPNFDSRWLAKYISAPVEAAALALAIVSLIESGAIVLGGQGFDFSKGKPFAVFGIGALVGFGIREVVGWLGNVAKTMFPTDQKNGETTVQSSEPKNR